MELPDPLVVKKITTKMNKHIKDAKEIMSYTGITVIANLFLSYLFNKYKFKCPVKTITELGTYGISFDITPINNDATELQKKIYNNNKEKNINELKRAAEQIVRCMNNKISPIIVPSNIQIGTAHHANVLIIRPNNTVERFEPHGSVDLGLVSKLIDDAYADFVSLINSEIKKVNPSLGELVLNNKGHICPNLPGLQKLEEESILPRVEEEGKGYCLAWSLFFIELVLKNPNISSEELYKNIYNVVKHDKGNVYLRKMIRGYVIYMSSKINKYFNILLENGIDIPKIMKTRNDKLGYYRIAIMVQVLVGLEVAYSNGKLKLYIQELEAFLVKLKEDIANGGFIDERNQIAFEATLDVLKNYIDIKEKLMKADTASTDKLISELSSDSKVEKTLRKQSPIIKKSITPIFKKNSRSRSSSKRSSSKRSFTIKNPNKKVDCSCKHFKCRCYAM